MFTTRYSNLVIIFAFSALVLIPNLTSISYGQFGTDVLHWQIVSITDQSKCRPTDIQHIEQYDSLIQKYFELYQFDTFNYEPNCMSLEQFASYQKPYYFDLLILFFDQDFSSLTLANMGLNGLYVHTGIDRNTNHFILLNDRQDYESDLDSKNPSWILSSSLSHLILYYKGYDEIVIEKLIHPDNPLYSDCFGKGFASNSCSEVRERIRADDVGKNFIVIPPFEGAIGNSLIQYLKEEISESNVSKNLHKQITKWWLSGKLSDDDYIDAIKLVARIPSYSIEIFQLEPLKVNGGFAIPVLSFDKEIESKENSLNRQEIEKQLGSIENFIPFERQNLPEIKQNSKFPDWFKERASLWVDGEVSDFVFLDGLEGLLRSKNIIP